MAIGKDNTNHYWYFFHYLKGFHECLGTTFGDGSKVVDEVGLGHTNTSILDCDSLAICIWNDLDVQIFPVIKLGGVSQTLITDFVQCLSAEIKVEI